MEWDWVDIFALGFYALEGCVLLVALLILFFGIDDLVIDLMYWGRRIYRRLTVYRHFRHADPEALYGLPEKPLAIMVPAWQEADVIAEMADLAATTLDYENYHIFIGTYPNDSATQEQVDKVCARHPNVHKVVCALPGPTSKADCLNNVIDSIQRFEERAKVKFAGFILHDSEDVISPLELRLFNLLIARKDMIQLPVYPLPGRWHEFTRNHYIDEFAENHAKDVVVREAMIGQVPSAGVGTCFSRRAIHKLLAEGDGLAFDVRSLTEDYDIGFRLSRYGMSGIFVRFPDPSAALPRSGGYALRNATVSVREYFPASFSHAVRQKARWIVGIVFQGMKNLKWTGDPLVNYFLWRDRRGAIANLVGLVALAILILLSSISILYWFAADWYRFPPLVRPGSLLETVLVANGVLFLVRATSRAHFVAIHYGWKEGGLSVLRTVWGMLINFLAMLRAMRQVLQIGSVHRVAWDKTQHQFPEVVEGKQQVPVGLRLVDKGYLGQGDLEKALAKRHEDIPFGHQLVREGLVAPEHLAEVLAEQAEADWRPLSPQYLPKELIAQVPASVALKYSVLPIAEEGETLILARESRMSPVALAAVARRLKRAVHYVIAPPGTVTAGLRFWYSRQGMADDPRRQLEQAVAEGRLAQDAAEGVWVRYVSGQRMLGDHLLQLHFLEPAVMNQALIAYEHSELPFGQFLVEEGYLSPDQLQDALVSQLAQQPTIEGLIRELAPSHEKTGAAADNVRAFPAPNRPHEPWRLFPLAPGYQSVPNISRFEPK